MRSQGDTKESGGREHPEIRIPPADLSSKLQAAGIPESGGVTDVSENILMGLRIY